MRFPTLFATLALAADPAFALGNDAGGKWDFENNPSAVLSEIQVDKELVLFPARVI